MPPAAHLAAGTREGWVGRRWWPDATAVILYVALGAAAYAHAWAAPTTRVVGLAYSDPIQQMWFLSWTPFAIGHGHNPLFSAYANVPHGVSLVTNTGEQLLAVISWPFNALFGPITALNVMFTLAFAASATAGYLLARRFTSWRPAAFVAGLLYGFCPYMIGQGADHLQLAFVALPPLIFLVIERLLVDPTRRHHLWWGALLGVLVVAQFFISSEVLTDTAVLSVIGVIVLGLLHPAEVRPRVVRVAAGLAVAVVLAGIVLAFPIIEGLHGPGHVTGAIQLQPQIYRSDLLGIIVPGQNQLLAPTSLVSVSNRFIDGNTLENGAYLGLTLLAVLLAGLVALRTRLLWFFSLMAFGAWVLSLGSRLVVSAAPTPQPTSGLWLPEALFTKIPVLSNTEPVRYTLFVALFAAVALALILDRLYDRTRPRSPLVAVTVSAVLAAVALFPLLPALPYAASAVTVPRFFTTSAVTVVPQDSAVLLYPFPQFGIDDALPMLWQVRAGFRFKVVGGYFIVPDPPGGGATAISPSQTGAELDALYGGAPVARTPALRAQLRAELRAEGVSTVVAERAGKDPAAAMSFLTWLVGRAPHEVAGAEVWDHVVGALSR